MEGFHQEVQRKEDILQGSVLSCYHVRLGDQTQAMKVGRDLCFLLSYLTRPGFFLYPFKIILTSGKRHHLLK